MGRMEEEEKGGRTKSRKNADVDPPERDEGRKEGKTDWPSLQGPTQEEGEKPVNQFSLLGLKMDFWATKIKTGELAEEEVGGR
jgi:hypothetical protein